MKPGCWTALIALALAGAASVWAYRALAKTFKGGL